MKAISTKRTTVKMCLFHSNTRVKHDFHLWVHELLMRLKTNQAANCPRQARVESYLPNGNVEFKYSSHPVNTQCL